VDKPVNTKNPLHVSSGPTTRSKAKALKEALNELVVQISAKAELEDPLEHQKETLHLIHMQEGPNHPYLSHEVLIIKLSILYQFQPALLCDVFMCFVEF
jgi:hypothetical protein